MTCVLLRTGYTAALCAAVVLGGCGGGKFSADQILDAGKDLKTAFTGVDEKEEIQIGREVAGRTLGAAHLVADRALQAYVNRVGHWVAMQSERPDLPWAFGIIETSSINAFASPGGYVLITRGLYQLLDNEAQLAGVLGHEISHIVRRHHITVMQKSAALSAGARLAQRDNRAAYMNNLIGSGAEVFARGLDKDSEFEADQRGVVLAARAGYNPYGLIEVLHKLQARSSSDPSLTLLFATHPPATERLSKLGELVTPKIATLPTGRQPQIRRIAVAAPPPSAPKAAVKPAAKPAATAQDKSGSSASDPAQMLRGLFK